MILSDVFERFSQDSPSSVMAQGVMENALNPQVLDELFEGERHSDWQPTAFRNRRRSVTSLFQAICSGLTMPHAPRCNTYLS